MTFSLYLWQFEIRVKKKILVNILRIALNVTATNAD